MEVDTRIEIGPYASTYAHVWTWMYKYIYICKYAADAPGEGLYSFFFLLPFNSFSSGSLGTQLRAPDLSVHCRTSPHCRTSDTIENVRIDA